jgi:membrane-associated phospholipid phosphatase
MKILTTLILLTFYGVCTAQTSRKYDFLRNDTKVSHYVRENILPGTLVSIGVFGFNRSHEANFFNTPAKYVFNERLEGRHIHIDDFMQHIPVLTYMFTGCGRENFGQRLMVTTTASLLTWGIIMPVKSKAGETRPDFQSDNSFPSGHTATAFMGAELLRLGGYDKKITIPAYIIATAVGCLRIHNNRHWFNDVVAGAGIGIFSARAAYWLLPIEKRFFRADTKKKGLNKIY